MKSLKESIERDLILEHIKNELTDKLKFSLSCWIKTFKCILVDYEFPKIFENAGQFNNCGKVIKLVWDYIQTHKDKKEYEYEHEFDCSDLDVFFKNLIINVKHSQHNYGQYDNLNNDTVKLDLFIKPVKDLSEFSSDVEYTLVHELTHAYEDHIRKGMGLPSINTLMKDPKYRYEYNQALRYMHIDKTYSDDYKETDKEYVNRIIAKCRYFLDETEMEAYLGTVKSCTKNITKKVGPSFRSLKFDKVIELFKDEYIWEDYLDIHVFMKNIDEYDEKLLQDIYYYFYNEKLSKKEIIENFQEKWIKFEKLFLKYFSKSYAKSIADLKLESFYQPPLELLRNPYIIYD